ncbi:hypothetical protein HYDPIDRAFT_117728 [Hydnomerulius pinastri MD-312]|uniref:Uncharacterized protein n=1 Tax=Hydnomerulius pinastri MD-312 TaxID=994086 RepID=A0A0C9V3V0_9AGAM|nr:hypothetical protein HYDPIDRAFT_117728 [Hydnomerulius pinastri MD-312]
MTTSDRQTVIIPIELGAAAKYDPEIFPLSSYRKRDSLGRGDFLLEATLDEMLKITNMGADPRQWEELIATTKARYDQLTLQKTRLEERSKTKNPFKVFANYRAARLFLDATKTLYIATRSRSEQMKRSINRNLLSVPREDVRPVGVDGVPSDASIAGFAITLDGPLDEDTARTITDAANTFATYAGPFADDPFVDPLSSVGDGMSDSGLSITTSVAADSSDNAIAIQMSSSSSQVSSPTSVGSRASINNYYVFHNSVYSPNSNVNGATLNQGGSQNSGSVNHHLMPPTPSESP